MNNRSDPDSVAALREVALSFRWPSNLGSRTSTHRKCRPAIDASSSSEIVRAALSLDIGVPG